MGLIKSLQGMLEVELTSAEPETALQIISGQGIELFRMKQIGELSYRFQIRRSAYPKLKQITQNRGETVIMIRKIGIYWLGKEAAKRPVMLLGMLTLFAVSLWVPSKVFFIRVEGNTAIQKQRIIAAAEESGIRFGASRSFVRSEQVKNSLLSAIPELQWAGVNTAGCVATISVRERAEEEKRIPINQVSSIVAETDGYILSATATKGRLLVRPGQTVTAGQLLISGYTDCGICIQASSSEGEVWAQTNRSLKVIAPAEYKSREEALGKKRKISLLIRKKRIILWKDSGILDSSCGRMYEEYYITLPGGFSLPVALCVDSYWEYEETVRQSGQTAAQKEMLEFSQSYLKQQMVSGNIVSMETSFSEVPGAYCTTSQFVCTEMIGRIRLEEIGDTHGKNS